MYRTKRDWLWALGALAVIPLSSGTAAAEGMEGAKHIVCGVSEVVACTDASHCMKGPARHFDLHELAVIDLEKKLVGGHQESGITEVSPIQTIQQSRDHLILQGVENGRGWITSINTQDGAMSTAVAGEDVSFMIFGTCTAL